MLVGGTEDTGDDEREQEADEAEALREGRDEAG